MSPANPIGKKMDQATNTNHWQQDSHPWKILEGLIAADPVLRETALQQLAAWEGLEEQPLMIYLLATRILDPDLEIRYHAVQILGDLVDYDHPGEGLPAGSLQALTAFTAQLDKGQLIQLLEVSAAYLAAEEAVGNILKLCSYAGKVLGGIVNDRRLTVEIRQQALFYCGEVGFLNTRRVIDNLIQRVRKAQANPGRITTRKKHADEETLLPFAVAALGKLESS